MAYLALHSKLFYLPGDKAVLEKQKIVSNRADGYWWST